MSERLTDALRAEAAGQDLLEKNGTIQVRGMREDGSLYELGWVAISAAYQDKQGASTAIERIKFGMGAIT